MNQDASNFVGSIPEHYDNSLGPRIFIDFANDLSNRAARIKPQKTLELAAGTGIVSRVLRDRLPNTCEIVITDLNNPMLDQARKKFGPDELVHIRQADAMSLPFDDSTFDCVICQFGVMFFPEKLSSYQEVLRVLKPGGTYLFNVWDLWEHNPFAQLAHETVAGFFPDDPPGFYKVPFSYRDTNEISSTIIEAGFSTVSHEVKAIESSIPSSDDFAKGLVLGNPLYDEILARDGNPDDIQIAISTAIKNNLGDSMPLQAIVISADK